MTSASVEEWVNSSLSSITNEKFKDCVKVSNVEIAPLTDQIVVVVSDIYRVKMTLEYKNGDKAELKAVFKMEPLTKQGFGEFAKEAKLCDTELMIYSKVLTAMENMISSNDETKELLWPQCYLCHNNQFLLQDLCIEGYKVVPTYDMLDVEHTKLALKAIGKYHAMSLVLKEKGIIEPDRLPVSLLTEDVPLINNMYSSGARQLADFIQQEWQQEWRPVADKLRKAVENVGDKLRNLIHSAGGKCSVLTHGDFSMRNMLFQYEDPSENSPVNIKLIDFQGSSWSNLALDLSSLLSSSIMPQTREENIDQLLNAYSKSLAHWCSEFGYEGTQITSSDVRQAYDSFGYFTMLGTLFAIPAFLGSKENFIADALSEFDGCLDEVMKKPLQPVFFKQARVEEALKYQLEVSLKQNIL